MVDPSKIEGLTKALRTIAANQRADDDLADTRNAVNDAARVVRNLGSKLFIGWSLYFYTRRANDACATVTR